jgi:pilus assembly protein Flp/PilA
MSKTSFAAAVKRFLLEEDGPTAVEYAVMLALILLSVMGTVGILATETSKNFDRSADAISGAFGN